jgi:hypothetical protein
MPLIESNIVGRSGVANRRKVVRMRARSQHVSDLGKANFGVFSRNQSISLINSQDTRFASLFLTEYEDEPLQGWGWQIQPDRPALAH